jgi:hypothetical protein
VLGSTVDDVPAQSVLDSLKRADRAGNSSVLIIDSSLNSQNDKTWREIEKARQLADQIDRMLGRTSVPDPSPLRCGPLIINTENHEVRIHDRLLNLTETEMRVLYYFARHAGELVSRDDLLSAIWGNKTVKNQILDVYMKRLRARYAALKRKTFRLGQWRKWAISCYCELLVPKSNNEPNFSPCSTSTDQPDKNICLFMLKANATVDSPFDSRFLDKKRGQRSTLALMAKHKSKVQSKGELDLSIGPV